MSKVYRNLFESVYSLEIGDLKLYFISAYKMQRFKDTYNDYVKTRQTIFNSVHHVNIDLSVIFTMSHYMKTNFHFLVEIDGEFLENLDEFIHHYEKRIYKWV